jgi:hypothetical protein
MAYVSNGIEELRRQRQGVCHRCGWPGAVGVVGRSARRRLRTGHQFGRLCHECVDDLARTHPAFQPAHEVTAARTGKSRKVA